MFGDLVWKPPHGYCETLYLGLKLTYATVCQVLVSQSIVVIIKKPVTCLADLSSC